MDLDDIIADPRVADLYSQLDDNECATWFYGSASWRECPSRVSLDALVQGGHGHVAGLHAADGQEPVVFPQFCGYDAAASDPEQLLLRAAFEFTPELYVRPVVPKRRRGKKSSFSLGEAFYLVRKNHLNMVLATAPAWREKLGLRSIVVGIAAFLASL